MKAMILCKISFSFFFFFSFTSPCVCAPGLLRFHEALDLCKSAGSSTDWADLGQACLVHMEVELAVQVFRASGNVGMVLSLQSIQVSAPLRLHLLTAGPALTFNHFPLALGLAGHRGHEFACGTPGHVPLRLQPGAGPLSVL